MPKLEQPMRLETFIEMNDDGDLDVVVFMGQDDPILERVISFSTLLEEFTDHAVFEWGVKHSGEDLYEDESWKTFIQDRGFILDKLRELLDKYDKRKEK
jgi:hypothetical protein